MIYTKFTKLAMQICFEAHKDQTDKSQLPYVFHPIHLAEQMQTEETIITALLHDVVEDSSYTLQDLKNYGFPETVLEAVSLLTHEKTIPYFSYIAAIKQNSIARAVKLADLRHNSDLSRLDKIRPDDLERRQKYLRAIAILEDKN
ncbi:MAG: GTP pyrophosphokinase [Oscillospiraceae bacterium]|nr:GTP pyrophosphokinase [Oscillospiraceae bacterium]